jgi:hypothetical protein
MTDDKVQVMIFVSGYLTLWGEVSADVFARKTTLQMHLRTDKAHDPYGMFDHCDAVIERNSRHFHKDA